MPSNKNSFNSFFNSYFHFKDVQFGDCGLVIHGILFVRVVFSKDVCSLIYISFISAFLACKKGGSRILYIFAVLWFGVWHRTKQAIFLTWNALCLHKPLRLTTNRRSQGRRE